MNVKSRNVRKVLKNCRLRETLQSQNSDEMDNIHSKYQQHNYNKTTITGKKKHRLKVRLIHIATLRRPSMISFAGVERHCLNQLYAVNTKPAGAMRL